MSANIVGTPAPLPTDWQLVDGTVTPVRAHQRVTAPPTHLCAHTRTTLARSTVQGSHVTWRSRTPQVCTVSRSTLTTLKAGTCSVAAKAASRTGYVAYAHRFAVRVIRRG